MSTATAQTRTATRPAAAPPKVTPAPKGLVQRQCACGGRAGVNGECEECRQKRLGIQSKQKKRLGLQPKLRVNTPGDKYEQEADRVAEAVVSGATVDVSSGAAHPSVQQASPSETAMPFELREAGVNASIGRDELHEAAAAKREDNARVRRKAVDDRAGPSTAPPIVDDVVRSSGQPLDTATRTFMESRFGHDFSRVRLHTDEVAAQSARALNARAYTTGHHIVLGRGELAPSTREGRWLLAHELTHVIQQRGPTQQSLHMRGDPRTPRVTNWRPLGFNYLDRASVNSSLLSATNPPEGCDTLARTKVGKLRKAINAAKRFLPKARKAVDQFGKTGVQSASISRAFKTLFSEAGPSDQQALDSVQATIRSMDSAIGRTNVDSSSLKCPRAPCGDDIIAFVPLNSKEIHLCPEFFKMSKGHVVALLHELAHTVLNDEPDVYVQERLFSTLAGRPERPGVRNPDSLALFIISVAKGIKVEKVVRSLGSGRRAPKDTLRGFASSLEEELIREAIGLTELTANAALRETKFLEDDLRARTSRIQLDSRNTLLRLKIAGLLRDVTVKQITASTFDRSDVVKEVILVRRAVDSLASMFDGPLDVARKAGDQAEGVTVAARGKSIEVFDNFFPQLRLPTRAGGVAEMPETGLLRLPSAVKSEVTTDKLTKQAVSARAKIQSKDQESLVKYLATLRKNLVARLEG